MAGRWHGLMFAGWTMRAIREGRKTVTRRAGDRYRTWRAGDRLWCRETTSFTVGIGTPMAVEYRADRDDDGAPRIPPELAEVMARHPGAKRPTWRPAILMPLAVCREFLEIEDIALSVYDPFEIAEEEARREGAADLADWRARWTEIHGPDRGPVALYRIAFRRLPASVRGEALAASLSRALSRALPTTESQ